MKFFRCPTPTTTPAPKRADASLPCVGDGMGNPSTCQTHMAEWYRDQQRCEVGRTAPRA